VTNPIWGGKRKGRERRGGARKRRERRKGEEGSGMAGDTDTTYSRQLLLPQSAPKQ